MTETPKIQQLETHFCWRSRISLSEVDPQYSVDNLIIMTASLSVTHTRTHARTVGRAICGGFTMIKGFFDRKGTNKCIYISSSAL